MNFAKVRAFSYFAEKFEKESVKKMISKDKRENLEGGNLKKRKVSIIKRT